MRKIILAVTFIFSTTFLNAQNVGIGTTAPNANAALEIKSSNKGLLMPRLSTVARTAMTNVPKGMIVFDSSYNAFYFHDGGRWRPINDANYDSLLTDNSTAPEVTANMNGFETTMAKSGILYDNGGPAGNYNNNSADEYTVEIDNIDDSTVGYKVIVEALNLESPYDSLIIYTGGDYANRQIFTGNRTGVFYFQRDQFLVFAFKSNGVNNLPGFKIRWGKLTSSTAAAEPPPLQGWYYNSRKQAARGGMNLFNNWSTDSLGWFSLAYGYNAKAKGAGSFAAGIHVSASGNGAVAMGDRAIASGKSATAIGSTSLASGGSSIAMGDRTVASGGSSIAMGSSTTASGSGSTAMGSSSIASGNTSTAMGNSTASGIFATAMGGGSAASGIYSTAMGSSTTASGSYSTAMGLGTFSKTFGGTAIGVYNDISDNPNNNVMAPTDRIFQVGNGNSSAARTNALTILRNGNIGIGTSTPNAPLQFPNIITNRKIVLWEEPSGNLDYYGFGINAGTLRYNVPFVGSHTFYAGSNHLVNINSNGHVGIGTLTQHAPLQFPNTIVNRKIVLWEVADNEYDYFGFGINSAILRYNVPPGGFHTFYGGTQAGLFTIATNGNAYLSGTLFQSSDVNFKKNIIPLSNNLSRLTKLNGYTYYWKDETKDKEEQIGLLAQEVQKLFPQLVHTDDKGMLSVNYSGLTPVLIEAVKELNTKLEKQQEQINQLLLLLKK